MKQTYDELVAGLRTVREMVRGSELEHAIVDMADMETGLGAFIDRLLDAAQEPKEDK